MKRTTFFQLQMKPRFIAIVFAGCARKSNTQLELRAIIFDLLLAVNKMSAVDIPI